MTEFANFVDPPSEEYARLKLERDRYRDALQRIAEMDFRGHRSQESVIAYRALNGEKS